MGLAPCLSRCGVSSEFATVEWGYRTLRVAGSVTFWLSGTEKSVFKLVGTNYEDEQILLLEGRLFSADGVATARNERRDPSGSRLRRLRGGMGSLGTPASRQAPLLFL